MWIAIAITIGVIGLFYWSKRNLYTETVDIQRPNETVKEAIKRLGATNIKEFEKGTDLFYTFKTTDGCLKLVKVMYLNKQKTDFKLVEVEK